MSRQDEFVTEVQDASRELWNSIHTLLKLQHEWTYSDYATTLEAELTLTTHPSVAKLSNVVNTTANAFNGLLANGHGTNITQVL